MFAPLQPEDALLNHLPFFGSRETSLIGTADFAYWRDRLSGQGVVPMEEHGATRVQVRVTEGHFLGYRLRAFSVGVAVHPELSFLVHAYTSSRLYALVERLGWGLPYSYGSVYLDPLPQAVIEVSAADGLFWAAMGPTLPWDGRRPVRRAPQMEDGPTRTYAFDEEFDLMKIALTRPGSVLRDLADSRFTPREWVLTGPAAQPVAAVVRGGKAKTDTIQEHLS
jgi:hypothetical protein